MQHSLASNWFVLTLSAEQAAKDQDFEHLDTLMRRRSELLDEWEAKGVSFSESEQSQIAVAEKRLASALESIRNETGAQLRELTRRQTGTNKYRTAS